MPPRRFLDIPTVAVARNIVLITLGAFLFAVGVKAVAVEHGFISGGVSGLGASALLSFRRRGYRHVVLPAQRAADVRRLVQLKPPLHSLYPVRHGRLSVFMDMVALRAGIDDPMLAAIFSGAIMGAG
jgi:uncharacterized membrane-anchored protein YitT (DUF2179 family)